MKELIRKILREQEDEPKYTGKNTVALDLKPIDAWPEFRKQNAERAKKVLDQFKWDLLIQGLEIEEEEFEEPQVIKDLNAMIEAIKDGKNDRQLIRSKEFKNLNLDKDKLVFWREHLKKPEIESIWARTKNKVKRWIQNMDKEDAVAVKENKKRNIIKNILKEELLKEGSGLFTKNMAIEITDNVLAYPEGKTKKTYNFLDKVKGESAVGRLHFTTSGLPLLYTNMGNTLTEHYFDGRSVRDLKKFSERVNGRELDYDWWEEGMEEFLNSTDSIPIQNNTIYEKFSNKFGREKYGNVSTLWTTPREFAIGMAAQNSANRCLYRGRRYNWNAEELMRDYCVGRDNGGCPDTGGCRSRCKNINEFYPAPPNQEGYIWTNEEYRKYC